VPVGTIFAPGLLSAIETWQRVVWLIITIVGLQENPMMVFLDVSPNLNHTVAFLEMSPAVALTVTGYVPTAAALH
jgi:hypothetical protein